MFVFGLRSSHSDFMLFIVPFAIAIISFFSNAAADPGPPYILSFTPWGYAADCDLNDLNNASAYRGFEIDLLRDAMDLANLTYGVDLVFQCALLNYESYLIGDNGSQAIIGSFGSYPLGRLPFNVDYSFSVPTKRSGISILYVKDISSEITKLFYFQSFTWELYLVLVLLPLMFGLVVYIFQAREQNWFNFGYNFYLYFFKIDFLKNLKSESRLLELVFLAAMTVIVTLYTARLTDVLAGQKKFGGVNTIDDLRGVRIASTFLMENTVKNLGGRYVQVEGITKALEEADPYKKIGEIIRNSNCSYYLSDTESLEMMVQQECEFEIAFKDVLKVDYAMVWAPHAPEEIKTKMDIGILKALETKSEYVRIAETLESFLPKESCPVNFNHQAHVTVNEVAGLWIIWFCFLAVSFIIFLTSVLMKRYCRVSRTPFDQELRGKREGMIKNELSAYFCGNILISLDYIREYKQFLLENSRYCSEKLNLNPAISRQVQLLLNNDEEMISLASPSRTYREDSIIPISPKKTPRLQSLISKMSLRSPKQSSDSSSPSIIVLQSPKNTPTFRKELTNAAKRLNKDSLVQFSKQNLNNFIIQFATRQTETIAEKEVIIKVFSNKFNLKQEELRQRFIVPKVNSNTKWLQTLIPAPSKKKQPKNKLLSELLYLDYKTAFASDKPLQPLVKSVETSVMVSMSDFEEKNRTEQDLLRPQMVDSLLQIRRQRKQKSPGEKTKKRILDSFRQSAKPMDLKIIDLNQKPGI